MADSVRSFLNYRTYFPKNESVDFRVIWVLVISAFCLLLNYYYADPGQFDQEKRLLSNIGLGSFGNRIQYWLTDHPRSALHQMIYWACFSSAAYVLIPSLAIIFVFRQNLKDYGLKLKGMFTAWKVYLLLFLLIFPFVVFGSFKHSFQATYPFYLPPKNECIFPAFLYWELSYALQFFTLEFFFRGFMVQGTRHRFGVYSVFVMMVPYCLIHFAKPFPEACGAIIAGIVLGLLSFKTRSIWLGAMIHITVAVSMDLLSLWQKGYFALAK